MPNGLTVEVIETMPAVSVPLPNVARLPSAQLPASQPPEPTAHVPAPPFQVKLVETVSSDALPIVDCPSGFVTVIATPPSGVFTVLTFITNCVGLMNVTLLTVIPVALTAGPR